jgi:hypothetical protein
MTKITQDEFLNRIMTSDNSIQEAFTIDGLKALKHMIQIIHYNPTITINKHLKYLKSNPQPSLFQ